MSFMCVVDCKDHYASGARTDGVYTISVHGFGDRSVYCDMWEGGRTVIQRRFNGGVDFARGYDDYINGFGDVAFDHWLGLELMHLLTSRPGATNSLLIAANQYDGTRVYVNYANVWVDDRDSGYKLHVALTAQDTSSSNFAFYLSKGVGLNTNDGWAFTTVGHDVDGKSTGNCVNGWGGGGGWWYEDCSHFYINAVYGQKKPGGINLFGSLFVTDPIMSVIRN
jgi:ficolin